MMSLRLKTHTPDAIYRVYNSANWKGQRMTKKLTVKKIKEYTAAKKAFDKLVKAKAHRKLLNYWLRAVAAASTTSQPLGSLQPERRKVKGLAKRAKTLANEITRAMTKTKRTQVRANGAKNLPGEISPAHTTFGVPTLWNGHNLKIAMALPSLLREFAIAWTDAHALLWEHSYPISPQVELIGCFISVVEETTGAPHYTQVADLLNGIYAAQHGEHSHPRWDKDNLKYLYLRTKKRLAKPLKPRELPK